MRGKPLGTAGIDCLAEVELKERSKEMVLEPTEGTEMGLGAFEGLDCSVRSWQS